MRKRIRVSKYGFNVSVTIKSGSHTYNGTEIITAEDIVEAATIAFMRVNRNGNLLVRDTHYISISIGERDT